MHVQITGKTYWWQHKAHTLRGRKVDGWVVRGGDYVVIMDFAWSVYSSDIGCDSLLTDFILSLWVVPPSPNPTRPAHSPHPAHLPRAPQLTLHARTTVVQSSRMAPNANSFRSFLDYDTSFPDFVQRIYTIKELTFCADSYSVSVPPHPPNPLCYRSGT